MPQTEDTLVLRHRRYHLQQRIAQSAYGEVWSARRKGWQGPLAIKFVNAQQVADSSLAMREQLKKALENEIELLRSLERRECRHVVRLLDSGAHNGLPVLVMERLDTDLRRRVLEGASLPNLDQVLDWLAQAAEGLAAIHGLGQRHLDIKPANLLLSADGRVLKLADFGNRRGDADESHDFAGTLAWLAPEQLIPTRRDAQGYRYHTSQKTDLFALGLVFHFMLTGRSPRYCTEAAALLREGGEEAAWARRDQPLTVLLPEERTRLLIRLGETPTAQDVDCDGTWLPNTPPSDPGTSRGERLLKLLEDLLASAPARRPASAVEVIRRARGLANAAPGAGRLPAPEGEAPTSRMRKWITLLLAAGALGLAWAWWWSRE